MKIKIILLLMVLVLIGGNLYAASGDLKVGGNLIADKGITFPDNTVQTSASTLVWDSTVLSAITSTSSPTLSGMAAGGYRFEFWIYSGATATTNYSMYLNSDMTATNYYRYGIGGGTTTPPTTNVANNSIMVSLASTYKALLDGSINISPNGKVVALYNISYFSTNDSGVRTIEKTAAITDDLTRIDIVASQPLGIGVYSRFRMWRRN